MADIPQKIEGSISGGIDVLSSCGAGTVSMFFIAVVSCAFAFYLLYSFFRILKYIAPAISKLVEVAEKHEKDD